MLFTYAYQQAFSNFEFSYAAALASMIAVVVLVLFIGSHTTAWGPLFAGSVIATIPSIAVYTLAQRWFSSGLSLGGIR